MEQEIIIKFGVKGKILKGDFSPNGEILIEDDTEDTGGYYVFTWPKDGSCWPDSDKEMLYDLWFENYDRLMKYMNSKNRVIAWGFEANQKKDIEK